MSELMTVDTQDVEATAIERPMIVRVGLWMVIVGALAQAAGLGIDAYKHIADPTLAAREALLTFDNVGHVLLIGGIALVLAGLGVMLVGPRLLRAAPPIRVGVPLVVALIVGGASIAAANSSLSKGHDHGDAAAHASRSASASAGDGHDHGHGDGTEAAYVALDPKTRDQVSAELTKAREVALRYPTVADAEAAGYRKVAPYLPLIGSHYMRFFNVDGTFDIEQPEMLLYDGTSPTSEMVGLSYYVTASEEPEGFAGPNDHWHQHIGLCIDADAPVVIGDESTTDEECAALGGRKADGRNGWMVHAWVVPGWDSPQGVFSAENAQLR